MVCLPMANPYLGVEHLTKVYERGQVLALRDLSFAVEKGEFLVVIGLSGSGKSTLLRCINRLIEPTKGKIWLDGVEVTRLSQARMRRVRRKIGMIFQQFNLVDRSTAIANVLTGRLGYLPGWRALLGWFPEEDREKALASLERVGLRDKAYVRVDQLSGGQRQRVGIARALMQEPELLLADEPVSALDPATSHSIMQYLEQMNKEDGVTVIASLHFLSLARRYGTRIIALKDGQLVFDGSPQAIDNVKFKEIYGEDAEEVEVR
ncbi:phosphonate/organophosphate ester transporter subunit; ATP-binding component of ABC superfamily [Candidatus Bipolaricaulis anaerobius]|uniref:Phosphonate/organophosphate ester transporter subunit ATP-binding component of ABC superfamily n=2 Tax=Candidatus Bipolaricaulis anaerobius TaxID=2026885 RepID=A0A2X3MIS0_9BACT|nr:phosphonate/organophosphate ester transporter subunit; ATP-binding component of ABC superfamily [Candidatus Bipolaricaulis anaerobius]